MLTDTDIVAELPNLGNAIRNNFIADDGLVNLYILDDIVKFINTVPGLTKLISLTESPYTVLLSLLQSIVAANDARAPARSGYHNEVVVGSVHTTIDDQAVIEPYLLQSTYIARQTIGPSQQSIFDATFGPQPVHAAGLAARGWSAATVSSSQSTAAAQQAFGFVDGDIEDLGDLDALLSGGLSPIDVAIADQLAEYFSTEICRIGIFWETVGDVRLSTTGTDSALRLSSTDEDASTIAQTIAFPDGATHLEFHLKVIHAAAGSTLDILLDGMILKSIDLATFGSAARGSVPLADVSADHGAVTFRLTGAGSAGAVIEVDDFDFSVLANNAPTLDDLNLTLPNITVGGPIANNVGVPVYLLVQGMADADLGARTGIAVTDVATSSGKLQYSYDDGTSWHDVGAVSATESFLLDAEISTRVRFVPNAGVLSGTFNAFSFRAWDRSGGTGALSGEHFDSSVNGATTPFSAATESVSIALDAPVQITAIYARGVGTGNANWSAPFLAYLAANALGDASLGYLVSNGTNQLGTLSWSNVNTISIRFSDELTIAQNDLIVIGSSNGPAVPAITGMSWDAATYTSTWTFASALPRGKFMLHLGSAVFDSTGAPLDGEWIVSSSTASGNGTAGGDFNFRFNVLPGDFDGNNNVTITEVLAARNRAGKGTASVGYTFREDTDGNGNITITEVLASRNRTATSITGLNEPVAPGSTPQSPLEFAPLVPGDEGGLYASPYAALTEAELAPIIAEAISRWEASGLVPQSFDWSKLRFAITDLGPTYLGLGNPDGAILLDDDGAGWGWFVDSSPTSDDEFTAASLAADAAAHMDLLTVVMHEIGHALGYPTGAAQDTPAAALMSEFLGLGTRRTPGVALAAVPSDLLADVSQAAPMLGFTRLADFDYAPLAFGQVAGVTAFPAPDARPANDARLVGASLIDTIPNDGVIELLTVETESVAIEAVSAESFGVARVAKSKRLDVAGSAKSST